MAEEEEPVEITALTDNIQIIKDSVANALQWFSDSLVQRKFIARKKAQGIVKKTSVDESEKISLLMDEVYTKIENEDNKRECFDKFVGIFSGDSAHKQLVKKLRSSVGGA